MGGGLTGLGGYNGLPSVMSGLDESMSDIEARKKYPFELEKAMHNVMFIQHHMQRQDDFNAVSTTMHRDYMECTYRHININGILVFFCLARYRRIRTGDSLQWLWTDCSFGCSRWLPLSVRLLSCAKHPRSTMTLSQSLRSTQLLHKSCTISH